MFCQEAYVRVVQFSRAWCDNKRSYPKGWASRAGATLGRSLAYTHSTKLLYCVRHSPVCVVSFCLFSVFFIYIFKKKNCVCVGGGGGGGEGGIDSIEP